MATPAFCPDPPPHQTSSQIGLRRLDTTRITAVATCQQPVGVLLHYFQGRTQPHYEDTPCEPCTQGFTPRWKGYVTLYNPNTREHWLQEYTAAAHEGIRAALSSFGTLRGYLLSLERIRPSRNAPMRSEVYIHRTPDHELPHEPDIPAHLLRIWQLEPKTTIPRVTRDTTLTHLTPTKPGDNHRRP